MQYLMYSQILQKYKSLGLSQQVDVLTEALKRKDEDPSQSSENCIAMSIGYKLSVSGSGFYEKI